MKHILQIMVLTAALVMSVAPFSAWAETKILILGDSLSAAYGLKQQQGWVKLLQNAYKDTNQPITLINASISGETTGGALRRLPQLLKQHTPSHVLIELGGNDGLRGFPINRLQQNLTSLIETSQKTGAEVAIMQIRIPPNYGARYLNLFTTSFEKAAKQHHVYLMPFFLDTIATDKKLMQNDNIHPNLAAQPLLKDIMKAQIKQWFDNENKRKAAKNLQ